ncbi:hypothetical protein OG252_51940 [Streptomyces sp. NBC_01352]|uniref:hypothetical protein n=1 Tax=Streptomyces sp. NBC_01352 TaxID=2903834 RepID=UPI002E2FB95D|nr:hypothetical protein [Streptomyces sp. NBC_01352]
MSKHPDLPDTLVHFTGRPRGRKDLPPAFALGTPEERMLRILHSGVLRGSLDYWSDAPVICFSELTEDARRVMLRDGCGPRGPYEPWGLMLDRQQLIQAGARPVLYLSAEEMGETGQLPTRLRNRRVRYDPGSSDWLHEREWRLCFEGGDDPVLPVTPQLVVGLIVGNQGWTPQPRSLSPSEMLSQWEISVQAVRRAMEENRDLPWQSIPVHAPTMSFARPANGLPRWYWNGQELVPDGIIDIQTQEWEAVTRWAGVLPGPSVTVHPEEVWDELRGDGRV